MSAPSPSSPPSFDGASVCYEAAGDWRKKADVENNLAVLHAEAGRVEQAMEHVALALGSCPADEEVAAQVEDTRAIIALAAGDAGLAVDFAYSSVTRLRRLDNADLLVRSAQTLVRAGRAYHAELEEARLRAVLVACEWNLKRAARPLGFNSREALTNHIMRKFPRLDAERRNRTVT
ncbi:MAG: hypothetical protein LC795_15550 [Acidobacteria bacterium]|nr:hypothetical protein [Acidobacteriota bacterium]MCA1620690.1 hypothetical protein [Acidobacteriota bacterium]